MTEVSLVQQDSTLVTRARDLLAGGPASAVTVIGYVCNLPAPPESVALHLAEVLLGGQREFGRNAAGEWMLIREVPREVSSGAAVAVLRGLRHHRYVVVDVETTGSRSTGEDRIAEIAAVSVEGGEVRELYETLVNPERPIPPAVTRLTRITSEMANRAPRFTQVAERIGRVIRGRHFVGHNAAFDWRFVASEMLRATGQRLEGERLCTVRLTACLLPHLRRRTLDAVAHYFGVEIKARHRAAGDAVATAHVLVRLLQLAEERGVETIEDLRLLGRRAPKRRRKRRATPHWMTRDESA